tara:strand:- start:5344 stop:5949 length:606 start_codon:yes stop_codon:yes gene_type:complete
MIYTPKITIAAAGVVLLISSITSYAAPHGDRGNYALLSRAKEFERSVEELHRVIDASIRYSNNSRFSHRTERDRRSRSNSMNALHSLGAAVDEHSRQLVRSVHQGKSERSLIGQIRHIEEDLSRMSRMSLNRPIRIRLSQTQSALRSLERSCNVGDSHGDHGHGRVNERDFGRERRPVNSHSGSDRDRFSSDRMRAKRVTF